MWGAGSPESASPAKALERIGELINLSWHPVDSGQSLVLQEFFDQKRSVLFFFTYKKKHEIIHGKEIRTTRKTRMFRIEFYDALCASMRFYAVQCGFMRFRENNLTDCLTYNSTNKYWDNSRRNARRIDTSIRISRGYDLRLYFEVIHRILCSFLSIDEIRTSAIVICFEVTTWGYVLNSARLHAELRFEVMFWTLVLGGSVWRRRDFFSWRRSSSLKISFPRGA